MDKKISLVFRKYLKDWKDFTANNMKIQKAGLNGYAYELSVDYNIIDASNVINIHKYLMKKHDIK